MGYRIIKAGRLFAPGLISILAPLGGALILAAPSPLRAAEHDTLTIGVSTYPPNLNPLIDATVAKSYVLGMTNRPLTAYDAHWQPVCILCTELPTLENGKAVREDRADGKHGIAVTFTLKPGLKWGDGTPVTTRDVRFTWEIGRNPKSATANAELFRRITDVTTADDRTFTLHVDRVTYDYNAIDLELVPEHLERDRFDDPAQYRVRTRYETEPTNPGLYDGPYRIAELTPGSHVVLDRNSSWAGKPPAFKRIVVRAIENSAALESNLLSGSVDYVPGEEGLSLDQAIALEKRTGARFDVIYKPSLYYSHIDLNLDNPLLQDVRVRRALLMAIDREGINQQLFGGKQPPADSFVSPLDWIYDPNGVKYAYDPAAAGKLLDDAGWVARDGVRQNASGQKLSLELMGATGNRTSELVEQVMQSEWRKAGIEVTIRNLAARVLFDNLTHRRFTGMAVFGWASAPENVPRTILRSDQIPSEANNWDGQNYTGYKDPATDALLDSIETELDREKRRALWHALQRRYAEALPVLPLYFRSIPFIMPTWLGGITPTGHMFPTTLWVEDWTVK
ncbi:MAG TPA: peptide ABC transporter substrate-binding protein [Candidatus Sulfotelmatobacter sp.]|nr:peptide ABC transporter substrate-binding protein [Candidatus Sulfotelmatobacter sp.]